MTSFIYFYDSITMAGDYTGIDDCCWEIIIKDSYSLRSNFSYYWHVYLAY